jgi:phosphatidylinositol alpha-1,6-mannosyltransferase
MRTLLISEVFPPKIGGTGRWFWEIYRRLPPEQVVIAAGEDPEQDAFDRTHCLDVVRMPLSLPTWGVGSGTGLRGYWHAQRRLRHLISQRPIIGIHSGKCLPEGLFALTLKCTRGIPYLTYVHGEELSIASTSRELRWLTRRVLRGARLVIASSQNTQALLRKDWHVSARRIRILHPGVDCQRFVPGRLDAGVRRELEWGDRPVVLSVGRLQKRKGHDQVIRALNKVRQALPDVLYAVAGDGEERPRLEQLVHSTGLQNYVQFLGALPDERLISCYQQCDLFVLANRQLAADFEGFGIVLLEAQACGKAVLAGASGGTAETMRIPETGRIVDCERPDDLAAVIIELLSDEALRARMGAAARAWTVASFDWPVLCRQAEQIFAQAMRAPGLAPSRELEAVAATRVS